MNTTHEYFQELAALGAMALLEGSEAVAWSLHLGECKNCRAEAGEWDELAGVLAHSAAPVAPPAGLRSRLLAGLDIDNASGRKVIRAESASGSGKDTWQSAGAEGVDYRMLQRDARTGDQTMLVRLAPGAVYAPHRHAGSEHCYVLEGDLVFEDHALSAGDYAVCAAGTKHSSSTTRNGCLLLIINNIGDQLLVAH